jgi:hypothetical protein
MKEIKKLVMKHPIASILITIALGVPCSIDLYITGWKGIAIHNPLMVIVASIIFSIIAICLWGIVYYLSIPIAKQLFKDEDFKANWEHGIIAASFAFIIWAFLCVCVCFYKHLGFKWFILLVYVIPMYRIMVCIIQLFYTKILRK